MAKGRTTRYIMLKIPSGNFCKYHYISVNNSKYVNLKIIHVYINFYRNLNIYEACIPDHMHHIDLGLFKYQLEFTQEILKEVGGTELQKKFDGRLRNIPRFPGLKFLSKLGHLNVIIAADYRYIMKIDLFALNEIFVIKWNNKISCKEICELYAKFSKMYIMSRKELYTEKDLEIFKVSCISMKIIKPQDRLTT